MGAFAPFVRRNANGSKCLDFQLLTIEERVELINTVRDLVGNQVVAKADWQLTAEGMINTELGKLEGSPELVKGYDEMKRSHDVQQIAIDHAVGYLELNSKAAG